MTGRGSPHRRYPDIYAIAQSSASFSLIIRLVLQWSPSTLENDASGYFLPLELIMSPLTAV